MSDPAEDALGDAIGDADVVAWAQGGKLIVVGEPASIDAFVADLKPQRELDLAPLKTLASGANHLYRSGTVEPAKRYIELGARKLKGVTPSGGNTSEIFVHTRNAKGHIISSRPAGNLKALLATQPEVLIALAAIQMALRSLTETVEEVAKDVEGLKQIAETTDVGNLAGLYRVLQIARAQTDRTGTIPRTTWESIAPHEVTAQQAADRVRAYLHRVLDNLHVDEGPTERLKTAQRLVRSGDLRRSLRLLVLAEQNRLLWRSLKLDRVRAVEPDELEGEAEAATSLLTENAEADRALIARLREQVDQLCRLGALDGARPLTPKKLADARARLRRQVDEFAESRSQQIETWATDERPRIRDAAREIGTRANKIATGARRAVGGGIASFGSWVQGASSDEHAESPEHTDPRGQIVFTSDETDLGTAQLVGGRLAASTEPLQEMVDSMSSVRGLDPINAFEFFARGWSNGYVHSRFEGH